MICSLELARWSTRRLWQAASKKCVFKPSTAGDMPCRVDCHGYFRREPFLFGLLEMPSSVVVFDTDLPDGGGAFAYKTGP